MRKTSSNPTISLSLCVSLFLMGCSSSEKWGGSAAVEKLDNPNQLKVVCRLRQVGFDAGEALARSERMSQEELAYLAEHPEAIKRTGFIILGALLGSTLVGAFSKKPAPAPTPPVMIIERNKD